MIKLIIPVLSQTGLTGLGCSHKYSHSVDIVLHFTVASQRDAYWKLKCVTILPVVVYHRNVSQNLCYPEIRVSLMNVHYETSIHKTIRNRRKQQQQQH